jgi:hypothetical protein
MGVVCFGPRFVGAFANRSQSFGLDAVLDQEGHHRVGTVLTQLLVEGLRTATVRVPLHLDVCVLGVLLQKSGEALQQGITDGANGGVIGTEVDTIIENDLVTDHSDLVGIRAAVVVRVIVDRLWLVRTKVVKIGDAVLVVVFLWATILVFETVTVLGFIGTLVYLIGDSVLIVVELRAAIGILVPISIFGLERAVVRAILDAILIVVELRAAIGIFKPNSIFGVVGTAIFDIANTVAIPIWGALLGGVVQSVNA